MNYICVFVIMIFYRNFSNLLLFHRKVWLNFGIRNFSSKSFAGFDFEWFIILRYSWINLSLLCAELSTHTWFYLPRYVWIKFFWFFRNQKARKMQSIVVFNNVFSLFSLLSNTCILENTVHCTIHKHELTFMYARLFFPYYTRIIIISWKITFMK